MPDSLNLDDVVRELHLAREAAERLVQLQHIPDAPAPALPDHSEAERLLGRLGVDTADMVDVLGSRPDPVEHPELWWILDHVYHDILATMGEPVSIAGFPGYPPLPLSTGATGRHLPVWTFLALVPAIRQFHANHGIPDVISWGSLGEALTVALRAHRSIMGLSGLGLWGFGWTLPLRFRGVDYQIGRLGYHLGEMSLSSGCCGYVLGVHILGGDRLDPEACLTSMTRALAFFACHFPERPITMLTCESWLMDPQLADYLDAHSNIVRFQRLFNILPLPKHMEARLRSDEDILGYVFNQPSDASLDRLPQDTTLQRAFVKHLRAGRHWHSRTGWRPVQGSMGVAHDALETA